MSLSPRGIYFLINVNLSFIILFFCFLFLFFVFFTPPATFSYFITILKQCEEKKRNSLIKSRYVPPFVSSTNHYNKRFCYNCARPEFSPQISHSIDVLAFLPDFVIFWDRFGFHRFRQFHGICTFIIWDMGGLLVFSSWVLA